MIPFRAWASMAVMCAASGAAYVATPRILLADTLPKITLESIVPKTIGQWQMDRNEAVAIADPQQKQTIDAIYSDTLSRIYVSPQGTKMMLSIAYGRNQTDESSVHYPEVCYPAQGMQVSSPVIEQITLNGRTRAVKHLVAKRGEAMLEPITYWVVIGNHMVVGGTGQKLAQLSYGLNGKVPDGMILRVSSIGESTAKEFEMQRVFLEQLIRSLPENMQERFAGAL